MRILLIFGMNMNIFFSNNIINIFTWKIIIIISIIMILYLKMEKERKKIILKYYIIDDKIFNDREIIWLVIKSFFLFHNKQKSSIYFVIKYRNLRKNHKFFVVVLFSIFFSSLYRRILCNFWQQPTFARLIFVFIYLNL